jgi:hypothetical protein
MFDSVFVVRSRMVGVYEVAYGIHCAGNGATPLVPARTLSGETASSVSTSGQTL